MFLLFLVFLFLLVIFCGNKTERFDSLRQYSDTICRIQNHFRNQHKEVIQAHIRSKDTVDVVVFDTRLFVGSAFRVRVKKADQFDITFMPLDEPTRTIKHDTLL
jgi:hypothetical protein